MRPSDRSPSCIRVAELSDEKENRLSESSNRLHKLMHQAKLLHNDVPLREPRLEVYSWPAIQDLRLALYGQNSIIFLPIYVVIEEAS
jgi:hypothetical protein